MHLVFKTKVQQVVVPLHSTTQHKMANIAERRQAIRCIEHAMLVCGTKEGLVPMLRSRKRELEEELDEVLEEEKSSRRAMQTERNVEAFAKRVIAFEHPEVASFKQFMVSQTVNCLVHR